MEKLDSRSKWSYSIGCIGRDMSYALVSTFLMAYIQFTMNLTTAQFSVIGILVMLCLVWDAFNDIWMGSIIESCKFKLGKYRPWILAGAILNAFFVVLLFTVRPEGWAFVGFFGFAYLMWGMSYTMNDISYWGMLPSLSSDAKERNMLVSLVTIFACVGQFLVAGVIPNVVAGQAVNAYGVVAVIIGTCMILFQLLTFFGVRERVRTVANENEKVTFKKMAQVFRRNDQLLVAGFAIFLFYLASNSIIAFGMNFFYFEFAYSNGGFVFFLATIMYAVGTLLAQIVYPFVAKVLSRNRLVLISTLVAVCSYFLFLSIGYLLPKHVLVVNVLAFLIFFAQGMLQVVNIVMLNNTIEYDQLTTGERHESIVSAVRSFAVKLAGAIQMGMVSLVLIISGLYSYSQEISELEAQVNKGLLEKANATAEADLIIAQAGDGQLFVLRLFMMGFPAFVLLLSAFLIHKKYKITEEKYEEILEKIK